MASKSWVAESVAFRKRLNAVPELGLLCGETLDEVKKTFAPLVPTASPVECGPGLYFDLHGRGPASGSPVMIAVRGECDALPFPSGNRHACGHDGHVAALLGLALVFGAELAEQVACDRGVRLFVQPGEESPGGALPMIEAGLLEGVSEVYGWHNMPLLPINSYDMTDGCMAAATDTFWIEIAGKGGHGAFPHHAADCVTAAATLVTNLNSIVSRDVPSAARAVLSVCSIHAGTAANVLPEACQIQGTFRWLKDETGELLRTRIAQIATSTASVFSCTALGMT